MIVFRSERLQSSSIISSETRLSVNSHDHILFRAEVVAESSEEAQYELSLAANFGKQDHDCIEIAHALGRLQHQGRTIKQMADICGGKSLGWVNQHLSLIKLHPDVQAMLIPEEDEPPRLALTAALMLANHPHGSQTLWAKKIAGMPMLTARRMLLREGQTAGVRIAKCPRRPRESYASLQTCLDQTIARLGVFVDMPGRDLRRILESSDVPARQLMINAIDELTGHLEGIGDTIEATMKIGGTP